MRFKNIIAVLIIALIVGIGSIGAGDYHKYVIYDDAVTTTAGDYHKYVIYDDAVTTTAGDYHKYVIYDDAVTTTNDTLISAWIPLNGASNVALFYNTDDTSYVKGSFSYRYGTDTEINSVVADTLSLDTRSSAATGLSKGKILQGYGLAASLIPGANAVRVTMIWQAGSETTTKVHVGLTYGD